MMRPTESEKREAAEQANRNLRKLAIDQIKIRLRAADVQAVYADPDRMEADRIWNSYMVQVDSIAFARGNKVACLCARFWGACRRPQ